MKLKIWNTSNLTKVLGGSTIVLGIASVISLINDNHKAASETISTAIETGLDNTAEAINNISEAVADVAEDAIEDIVNE